MINFRFRGEDIYLKESEKKIFKSSDFYEDTNGYTLKQITKNILSGNDWVESVNLFIPTGSWLNSIITSSKRTFFFKNILPLQDKLILDIGAGWGQFTIPLANNNKVCAMEPNYEKINFIDAVAQQNNLLRKIYLLSANFFEVDCKTKFDIILSIGVLEWVNKYYHLSMDLNPQLNFLSKCKETLSNEGKLIIGIENRIGLKYLLGSNDDHIGTSNISYLDKEFAKKKYLNKYGKELKSFTYSYAEYIELLSTAGFRDITFFVALPDYKLPEVILPISAFNEYILNAEAIIEHDGSNGIPLENSDEIFSLYQSLAKMNIAHYFAPSYYIIAK